MKHIGPLAFSNDSQRVCTGRKYGFYFFSSEQSISELDMALLVSNLNSVDAGTGFISECLLIFL